MMFYLVNNKFITMQNFVINIFLICKVIPEFVSPIQARSRRGKSIENAKKTCFARCKWVLFRKTASNKCKTVQNFVVVLLLSLLYF